MTGEAHDFLARVVERRTATISAEYAGHSRGRLEAFAAAGRRSRDFAGALTRGDAMTVIAEVKKASPSAGPIAPRADAVRQARMYESGGAGAVSVLTEPDHFAGSFDDLAAVASAVRIPVLCKDFVVDEAQAFVARGCGADAILLMVSVLGDRLGPYVELVRGLRMEALVEVSCRDELGVALEAGATVVGVNARDLRTLSVDPMSARALVVEAAAAGVTVVLASGVKTREDVASAAGAGASAVLVGEALMRAPDPESAVATLAGVPRAGETP